MRERGRLPEGSRSLLVALPAALAGTALLLCGVWHFHTGAEIPLAIGAPLAAWWLCRRLLEQPQTPRMETPPYPARATPSAPPTLLLVDDEPSVRALLKLVLEHEGFRVLEAADAPSARTAGAGADAKLDLLVTDLHLDGACGAKLARELGARHPRMKVLYISGDSRASTGDGISLPEDVAFLQKPFAPDHLIRKVRATMAGGGAA